MLSLSRISVHCQRCIGATALRYNLEMLDTRLGHAFLHHQSDLKQHQPLRPHGIGALTSITPVSTALTLRSGSCAATQSPSVACELSCSVSADKAGIQGGTDCVAQPVSRRICWTHEMWKTELHSPRLSGDWTTARCRLLFRGQWRKWSRLRDMSEKPVGRGRTHLCYLRVAHRALRA